MENVFFLNRWLKINQNVYSICRFFFFTCGLINKFALVYLKKMQLVVRCCRPFVGRIGSVSTRLSMAVLHLAREMLLTVCGDKSGRYAVKSQSAENQTAAGSEEMLL